MDTNDLKTAVFERIRNERVHMRSRAYFIARVAGLVLLSIAALVVTIFLLNFILFSIRLNRQDLLLGAGPSGWAAFVWFFPWGWLALDVLLALALQWLLRTFRWGWRIPALYLFGGLAALSVVLGFAIDRGTMVNDDLFEMRQQLPAPLGAIYGAARHHDIDDALQRLGIPLPLDDDVR